MSLPIRLAPLSVVILLLAIYAAHTDAQTRTHNHRRPAALKAHSPLLRFDSVDDAIRYAIAHEKWQPQRPPPDFTIKGPDDPRAFVDVALRTRVRTLASTQLGTFKAVYLPLPGDNPAMTSTLVYILRPYDHGYIRVARLPVESHCFLDDHFGDYQSTLLFCDGEFSMTVQGRRWLGDRFEE